MQQRRFVMAIDGKSCIILDGGAKEREPDLLLNLLIYIHSTTRFSSSLIDLSSAKCFGKERKHVKEAAAAAAKKNYRILS
jgi:hypothetical protein